MGTELHGIYNSSSCVQNTDDGLPTIRSNTSDGRARNISTKAAFCSSHSHLESMRRFFDDYNRDCIRNTMLNHEEIFRHQVQELHRLHQTQKVLMAESRSKEIKLQCHANTTPMTIQDTRTRYWSMVSTSETDSSSYISNADQSNGVGLGLSLVHPFVSVTGASSRDTGSNYSDGYQRIIPRGLNLEQPAEKYDTWESRTTQNQTNIYKKHPKDKAQIESQNLWSQDETGIELTLSIGCCTKDRSKHAVK